MLFQEMLIATGQVREPRNTNDQPLNELERLALALLHRIDVITSDDFRHGGDRHEREALRECLIRRGIDA